MNLSVFFVTDSKFLVVMHISLLQFKTSLVVILFGYTIRDPINNRHLCSLICMPEKGTE